jgi:transposase
MTKPLSIDLRERLISAVEGSMSRRAAAERFGVAASTAINWVARWRQTGSVRPHRQGGDYRSHRIEAHAEEILGLIEDVPDITLAEIAVHLERAHGLKVAQSTVWRLLDRRGMTKKPRTPANSSGAARSGTGAAGLHRRDRRLDQDGAALWPVVARRALPGAGAPRTLEDDHLRRRTQAGGDDRAHGA